MFKISNLINFLKTSIFVLLVSVNSLAQENTAINLVDNYKSWGWDAWVMHNGIVTIATVPEIGARIMQYDLGNHPSIFVNDSEIGNTYIPNSNSQWPNFGGFKNWPAPQNKWNWPPPPTLDFGEYDAFAETFSDSVSLTVTSPVEQWRTPDLRFKRRTTLFNGSSRVKVEQTLINEGSTSQDWSIWDVTQNIVQHPGENDFENFWVYFPINPESNYGVEGVRVSESSEAWMGLVAEGVYGVQYLPDAKKIFADSPVGWIAYVDERDHYLYAKTFEIVEDAVYPDDGARIEVWINDNPYYLEVEVLSPVVSLSANGGTYTFTEDWWAAKIGKGPVLSVNEIGAITQFKYSADSGRLSASFGVFYDAFARLEYFDSNGSILDATDTVKVSPLEVFIYDEPLSTIEEADSVRMVLVDGDLNKIGVLISKSIESLLTSYNHEERRPLHFQLHQNYPNPFNPSTTISYSLAQASDVKIEVFNMLGQSIGVFEDTWKSAGDHTAIFENSNISSGIYIYRIEAGEFIQTKKMILLK